MSDPVQLAIVAAITALFGGLPATIAALAALRQSRKNADKAEVTDKKADDLVKKTDEIHVLANSNLAKVTASLELANEKINGLEKLVTSLMDNRNAAAISAASITSALAATPPKSSA